MKWENKNQFYEGEFQNGKRNGFGVFYYSSEDKCLKYEGHYKDDLKHGKGVLYYRDNTKKTGTWVNGNFTE
jgi:hypothetical protein